MRTRPPTLVHIVILSAVQSQVFGTIYFSTRGLNLLSARIVGKDSGTHLVLTDINLFTWMLSLSLAHTVILQVGQSIIFHNMCYDIQKKRKSDLKLVE